ncbi:MAG: PrgI family protein [Candidatus Pacebacteria bacterium]|nr:PrgI family protein [Candidatus Paceibacterota bacterium]
MRFEVPKFIEFEDKIFGPFTWKQFLYLCGGAGSLLIAQHFIKDIFWSIIVTSPIIATALALTFYKVNGQNFSIILKASIQYFFRQKLYVWKAAKPEKKKPESAIAKPVTNESESSATARKEARIDDVSWGLDVLDRK